MKIGELAERSGIPASTIRYYEREGLLPKAQRGANGYRVYRDGTLERLNLIRLGQSLGFPLETIRTTLTLHGEALKSALVGHMEARLGEIDRLSAVLASQRRVLLDAMGQMQSAWAQGDCTRAVPGFSRTPAPPSPRSSATSRLARTAKSP